MIESHIETIGATSVPNILIDRIMPVLKDTEWRVLCVIIRQTLGWRGASGGRKTRDWLTQNQLKRRTGRNSEAISRAITTLVRLNLVDVCDESGGELATAHERRRHRGRLYYSLRLTDRRWKSR